MRRSTLIILLGIGLPSLLLAALALRTANEQRIVVERQTALLYQRHTDAVAEELQQQLRQRHQQFLDVTKHLLTEVPPEALAPQFAELLANRWRADVVGFAVTLDGELLSPRLPAASRNPSWNAFLNRHAAFVSSHTVTELYQVESSDDATQTIAPPQSAYLEESWRNVAPQQGEASATKELYFGKGVSVPVASKVTVQYERFSSAVSSAPSGILARFAEDQLDLLFWYRPPANASLVFGAALSPKQLRDLWPSSLAAASSIRRDACVAILDERGQPVAQSIEGFAPDWARPFVATELGETLPHWEVGLYLLDPDRLTRAVGNFRLALILGILLALLAIGYGSFLVANETRRQLALAQRKTDFVSNVSHELKSPLTSIRMFAELLEQNRVTEPTKRQQFLRVISLEAERLTRLINNVLDFAKLERKQKWLEPHPVDLYPVIQRTWEAYETHLRAQGFSTTWQADPPPYEAIADPDAVAQMLVNLLSNAEKYSADAKDVMLTTRLEDGTVSISVQDRGLGVPVGQERKIFEPFYRAHDALSSGIQGAGLGLTLAQRLAAEHGGTINFARRDGGGSVFTLRLPRSPMVANAARV